MSITAARRLLFLTALLLITLLLIAPAAHSQDTFFPSNTTLDATNPVPGPGDAIVGYADFDDYINGVNGTSPTIAIVDGGSVGNNLEVHNQSVINMSGGDIGANFGIVLADDNSTINLSGGVVEVDVNTQSSSVLNFTGGSIGGNIVADDNSTVNFSGGSVGNALLSNNSSTVNWSGGSVGDRVFVQDSSLLDVFGVGLSSVLTDPNFEGFYSEYTLSGSLLDNSKLAGREIFVQNGSGASLTLTDGTTVAPEPSTTVSLGLLLALCGLTAAVRRRLNVRTETA